MESTTRIALNLQQPNVATVVYAVQNDRLARHITAELVDGSEAWEPPVGALAAIRYLKPDGTAGFYDTAEDGSSAAVLSGSTVDMILAEQALTVAGDVLMQLNFYTGDGERLTTFLWILRVQRSVIEDAEIISSDYYNILSAQIAAVLNAAESLTGMTASATGLPTGASPTVNVTGGSGGEPYNLDFGIPAGPVGPPEIPVTTSEYQAGASGTTPPTGTWEATLPAVTPGNYLWTRTTLSYSDGTSAVYYTVSRQAVDGQGAPGDNNPLMDGVASPGISASFSREDHVHPSDTSRAEASTHNLQTYTLVTQLGLTQGSATLAGAYSAMPNKSMLIADAAQFLSTELPSTTGAVEIFKATSSGSRGWIYYHEKTGADYRMGLNASNLPDGVWWRTDTSYYKGGDTFSCTQLPLSGFVTNSIKDMNFTLFLQHSLEKISRITVNTCMGGVRGPGGYVDGSNDNYNWKSASGITISAGKITGNAIRLIISKTSAFTNVENNRPLSILATLNLTFNE